MSALILTISDLFFNSEEIKTTDTSSEQCILIASNEWLSNYPYFKEFITSQELAKDFLKRL
jgi:hypothetical protein